MIDWKGFLEEIEKEPKNFAKAIIENLNPPKYAVQQLKTYLRLCFFCWNPQADLCFLCQRSLCEKHIAKVLVGEKTKLEWYICPECLKSHDEKEIVEKVKEQDEEFWEEDEGLRLEASE